MRLCRMRLCRLLVRGAICVRLDSFGLGHASQRLWCRFTREGFTGYEPKFYDIPLCPLRISRLTFRFFRVLCVPTYEERSRHSESEYPLSHPSGTAYF
jgi:hypothetical protein